MRIFGSERIQGIVDKLGLAEDEAIESKMVSSAIESAQKKVEGNNFDIRKTLLQYDDVINKQREIIYKQRSEVLEGEDLKDQIRDMIRDVVYTAVNSHISGVEEEFQTELQNLVNYLEDICLPKALVKVKDISNLSDEEIKEKLLEAVENIYIRKEKEIGEEQIREIERVILLRVVDTKWMDHIDDMDHLKQGIGLRAYRQQDPVQAYQFEGSEMFEEMIYNIKVDTVRYLFHVEVEKAPEREKVAKETSTNYDEDSVKTTYKKENRIGRNDMCPCGSGKNIKIVVVEWHKNIL